MACTKQSESKEKGKKMKKSVIALMLGITAAVIATVAMATDLTLPKSQYAYQGDETNAWYFTKFTPNVTLWGLTTASQMTNVQPQSLTNISQLSIGFDHCVVLCSNSTVASWGNVTAAGYTIIPPGLDQAHVTQVVAGNKYTAALIDDGTVFYWGKFGSTTDTNGQVVSNSVPITQICYADTNEIFALQSDGGVLSISDTSFTSYPNIANAIQVAATPGRHMVLFSDGTVTNWGGNATNVATGATNGISIAIGSTNNVVLRSDGTVFTYSPTNVNLATGNSWSGSNLCIAACETNVWSIILTNGIQTPRKIYGTVTAPTPAPHMKSIAAGHGAVGGLLQ